MVMHVKVSVESLRDRLKRRLRKAHFTIFDAALSFVLDRHPGRGDNSIRYAENELQIAGYFDEDGFYGGMIGKAVMRQVKLFALEGHSGSSASICRAIADRVLAWHPLTPITGADDEWDEVGHGVFQNKRMSSIFKENGVAYRIDGRVFREPSGACYTSRDSRVPVLFPWEYQEAEIVSVDGRGAPHG